MPDPFVDIVIEDTLVEATLPSPGQLIATEITSMRPEKLPLLPRAFTTTEARLSSPCSNGGPDENCPDTRPDTGMLYPRG